MGKDYQCVAWRIQARARARAQQMQRFIYITLLKEISPFDGPYWRALCLLEQSTFPCVQWLVPQTLNLVTGVRKIYTNLSDGQ